MDVLAIERRDERPVEALDDLVREEIALVLDFLDLVSFVGDRRIGREHFFEQTRAHLKLIGHCDHVGVERFFPGEKAESQGGNLRRKRADCIGFTATAAGS
jgi:hypothetical protein